MITIRQGIAQARDRTTVTAETEEDLLPTPAETDDDLRETLDEQHERTWRETVAELRDQLGLRDKRIEELEGELDEATGETVELEARIVAQDVLAAEFDALVGQIDDLFTLRYLPLGLRLAIDEFSRLIGARPVIVG